MIAGFEETSDNPVVKKLFKEIKSLEPDHTLFFWDCSYGYCQGTFSEGKEKVMKLLSYIVRGKHIAGFFGFSAAALISNWDEEVLGPNPLLKISNELASSIKLMYSI